MSTTFRAKKNNAAGVLASDMAIDASIITLTAGQGSLFPAANFMVTVEDEIMLCTSRTGDALTVTRAQEGTAAAAHSADDTAQLRLTEGQTAEWEEAIQALEVLIGDHPTAVDVHGATGAIVGTTNTQTLTNKRLSTGTTIDSSIVISQILGLVFPIGCLHITEVATNPATTLGFGTWVATAAGKAIVGYLAADADFGAIGVVASGAKTVTVATHTHTGPSHTHGGVDHTHGMGHNHGFSTGASRYDGGWGIVQNVGGAWGDHGHDGTTGGSSSGNTGGADRGLTSGAGGTGATAAGGGHTVNNIQPSQVYYVWKRTA